MAERVARTHRNRGLRPPSPPAMGQWLLGEGPWPHQGTASAQAPAVPLGVGNEVSVKSSAIPHALMENKGDLCLRLAAFFCWHQVRGCVTIS